METICMKCQILSSWENKKDFNLSSTRVVKVKKSDYKKILIESYVIVP